MAGKKVLVLHGYGQNAAIFSKHLAALHQKCGSEIDFIFLDGFHALPASDIPGKSNSSQDLRATEITEGDRALLSRGFWTSTMASNSENGQTSVLRGWWSWKLDPEKKRLDGLEDTLRYLRDVLKNDRYEGVFGFSQGAATAALLTALLERPYLFPDFLVDGELPHPAMKFCIAVSGFKPVDPLSKVIFGSAYYTPTLHVQARRDVVVTEEIAKTLLDVSMNKQVEWHNGGHFMPMRLNWRAFFREYLRNPLGDLPTPASPKYVQSPSPIEYARK